MATVKLKNITSGYAKVGQLVRISPTNPNAFQYVTDLTKCDIIGTIATAGSPGSMCTINLINEGSSNSNQGERGAQGVQGVQGPQGASGIPDYSLILAYSIAL